jgi:hypothetical protein
MKTSRKASISHLKWGKMNFESESKYPIQINQTFTKFKTRIICKPQIAGLKAKKSKIKGRIAYLFQSKFF